MGAYNLNFVFVERNRKAWIKERIKDQKCSKTLVISKAAASGMTEITLLKTDIETLRKLLYLQL
jgi:hypothetical protein